MTLKENQFNIFTVSKNNEFILILVSLILQLKIRILM